MSYINNITRDKKPDSTHRNFVYGDIIQHFKRECIDDISDSYLYMFIGNGIHTETKEKLVIYKSLYSDNKGQNKIFARPYDAFMGEVDKDKYPDIKQKYRFEYIRSMYEDIN